MAHTKSLNFPRFAKKEFLKYKPLSQRRLARKVARGSVDRTAYSPKHSLSFMSHHAERISLSLSLLCEA